jgi:UDP-GlcNAc3NAcA epimerase
MLDAAIYYKERARKPQLVLPEKFILATIHRAENTDNAVRLKSIFDGFEKIGKEVPIILPTSPQNQENDRNIGSERPQIQLKLSIRLVILK